MKILYVSSNHPSLEYDDLTMLSELGIDWFSTGVYSDPKHPLKSFMTRQPINKEVDQDLLSLFKKSNPSYVPFENAMVDLSHEIFTQGKFDIVWISHTCPNLINNWQYIEGTPTIWRTYNQQPAGWEKYVKMTLSHKIHIVRMGETEKNRKTLAAPGTVIRAYVDEEVFSGWKGDEERVLTFYNRFYQRLNQSKNLCPKSYLMTRFLMKEKEHLFGLYGFPGNMGHQKDVTLGQLTQEEQIEKYQRSSIYFSLNSESAVYTSSLMEASMVGIPIVTFGPKTSNVKDPDLANTYEVPDLFEHGEEILIGDSSRELAGHINELLDNASLRRSMSEKVKKKARKLFSKKEIFRQWAEYLRKI